MSIRIYNDDVARRSKPYDLARLFAALADPTRLRLLNLMGGSEVCVCSFVEILRQSQPKISRHLAYLRNAEIVTARREGKWMHYSIRWPEGATAKSILDAVLECLADDPAMQADAARMARANCEPQRLVALQGVRMPMTSLRSG